ncbi:exo-alpha-sialidase [Spongiactinospora sp. TRM90649]|uniref:exo-alpha-sialidase n=1 Tax=Spongiactinospora sp. TRM90649 TaxID=3031114 RepID=UPI0023F755C0|nr:exo-alpha-sialidase [Spongiactinospora sp. TRM90649]MDF5756395.1 exo-alpha-sialidase [Spongiactinospora sp. TRM90649]
MHTLLLAAALVLGIAPPAAGDDPFTADVTVATAAPGKKLQFPDATRLADGRLLAVYREGASHSGQDGRILQVSSSDAGRTWSTPREIVQTPVDDRDPKIMVTRSGTVLLSYFAIDWKPTAPHTLLGTFVMRSADGGGTWSAPVKVGTAMDGGTGPVDQSYRLGWAANHGPIVELSGGDLLIPLYGTLPDNKWQRATVVRSTDGGRTWPASSERTIASGSVFHFQEPNLSVLRGGQLVSLIRTTAPTAYLSRSFDGGRTWSQAEATDLPASSHHQLTLRNGDILLTYGDLSHRFSSNRETVGRLIRHPERSWNGQRDLLLYDSGTGDQANPTSVEVSPGRFLTLSFDTNTASVVGVFSRQNEWLRDGAEPVDLLALHKAGKLTVDTDMNWTSATYPLVGPLGAIDGNLGYWASAVNGRSYTVNFTDPTKVRALGVSLKPGYKESAVVQVTSDGTNWRELHRFDGARTDLPEIIKVTGEPVTAIRVQLTDTFGAWGQVTELSVYN